MSFSDPLQAGLNDIFQKYPILASQFCRVSKEYDHETLLGRCNLELNRGEMIKAILSTTGLKSFFTIISDIHNITLFGQLLFRTPIFLYDDQKSDPTHKFIMSYAYKAVYQIDDNKVETPYLAGGYPHTTNNVLTCMDTSSEDSFIAAIAGDIFVDVKTYYYVLLARLSCQKINDYAKTRTKEYYRNKCRSYDVPHKVHLFVLFLILNAMVLGIPVDPNLLTNITSAESYNNYIEKYIDKIFNLAQQIFRAIDNFDK